jgi:hypothetical protein
VEPGVSDHDAVVVDVRRRAPAVVQFLEKVLRGSIFQQESMLLVPASSSPDELPVAIERVECPLVVEGGERGEANVRDGSSVSGTLS